MNIPLAERMRPKTLEEIMGQDHLLGKEGAIRKMLELGTLPSLIFWGPPGVGKTTLAEIIAFSSGRSFVKLSAIEAGVKDLRKVIQGSTQLMPTLLFIDEIHRFNKAQQDALLGAVERGIITLIGATTENPSFEVISALLSRCQVYVLEALGVEDLRKVLNRTIQNDEILKRYKFTIKEDNKLLLYSGGDCRKLLNLLELTVHSAKDGKVTITDSSISEMAQLNLSRYDKSGEMHYDTISAYIKSMRGSDPNASLYWLARMVNGKEDPLFIARRLVIFAAEDIGLSNPTALVIANNCYQACHAVGWPEARIVLSQATLYMANSDKSNSAYEGIEKAMKLALDTKELPIPLPIRNAPTKLMKDLGYGQNYDYPHKHPGSFSGQEYLPEKVSGTILYEPGDNPRESDYKKKMIELWKDKYYGPGSK